MDIIGYLDKKFYPRYRDNWDDTLFRNRVLRVLNSESSVLDIGAGAGIIEAMNFKGMAKKIIGIDLDPRVEKNRFLDEGVVGDATKTPFDDAIFDVILCDNVMEHIADPDGFFSEVHRLLKPGGVFLAKTPNKYHYMPLIASLTPLSFHRLYNRIRGREEVDTFPTQYKLNSPAAVRRVAKKHALQVASLELIEGRPEYLRIFAPLYLFGIIYERLVSGVSFLNRFSIVMIVQLKKGQVN